MPDWHSWHSPQIESPYYFLILGVLMFSGAVLSICTGKTSARTGRWIYRAKEPSTFWWVVAIYYLGALLFLGIYWYEGQ
jgi:hypothetical protein